MTDIELNALFLSPFFIGLIPFVWDMLKEAIHNGGIELFLVPCCLMMIGLGIIGMLSLIIIPLKYFMGC